MSADDTTVAVGTVWEVPDPSEVTRPDGTVRTVVGGAYVLDEPGAYQAGRKHVTAGE